MTIIPFPGQEKVVEQTKASQQEKWLEFFDTHVIPFTDRVTALAPDMGDEEFWNEVVALRDLLNQWIGGG